MVDAAPVLDARGVRAALGPGRQCALTVALHAGRIVRLAGPSGSGKTSLLRTCARLQAAVSGELSLQGRAAAAVPPGEWRRTVAYVPQRAVMLPGSVGDNLRAGFALAIARGRQPDAARVDALLDALQLPRSMAAQDARLLSGGEAARVALGRALLVDPAVLLLDETTAALDPDAAAALVAAVGEYLRTGDRAALVVAHNPAVWTEAVGETVRVETAA